MPGYILHLLHGKMCLEQGDFRFSEEEEAQFRIGLLMPDSNKAAGVPDDRSHFYAPDQEGRILKIPDLNAFPYAGQLENPFVLGYAAHLCLDRFFFGEFFPRYVHFLDAEGQPATERERVRRVFLTGPQRFVSLEELFSESFLYGDYTMLNRYIVERRGIEPVREVPVDNPIREVDTANLSVVLRMLDRFLHESTGSTDMRVFDPDSLAEAVESYAAGFCRWAETHRRRR